MSATAGWDLTGNPRRLSSVQQAVAAQQVERRAVQVISILPPGKGWRECGGSRTRAISRRVSAKLGK
jgi:hypothetical protein